MLQHTNLIVQDAPESGDDFVRTVVVNIRAEGICFHFRRLFSGMCHSPAVCNLQHQPIFSSLDVPGSDRVNPQPAPPNQLQSP